METVAQGNAEEDRRILTRAAIEAGKHLGLTNTELGRVIGVSPSTVSRMRRDDYHLATGSKSWELALLLVRLYRSLGAIVANDNRVITQWMTHFNEDLGGVPRNLIQEVAGLVETVDYLDAHRAIV